MKSWQEVFDTEKELIHFLQKSEFFEKPYTANNSEVLVITDPEIADLYFNKITESGDWQDIQNSDYGEIDEFPSSEFMSQCLSYVSSELILPEKIFHNANAAATNLQDNMISDFCRMFDFCCMEMEFPPVWKKIKQAYLNSGWPCGWDGNFPDGKLVIFSNDINLNKNPPLIKK